MSRISQDCWDHNRRLYREMTRDSTSRAQRDKAAPPERTRPTQDVHRGAQTSLHSVHPTPGSRMRQQAARTTRPPFAPTQQPSQASTVQAPTNAPPTNMSHPDLPNSDPQISYHIRTPTSSRTHHKTRPEYISQPLPPLTRSLNPPLLLQLLSLTSPSLHIVEYSCGCLNQGTCIHYQICFRRDFLPDGLICRTCRDANAPQEIIKGKRKCPRHMDDSGMERNWVRSRPEDFLPSEAQRERYETLMGRSAWGRWEGVAGMGQSGIEMGPRRGGREVTVRAEAPSDRAIATATRGMVPAPRLGPQPQPGREHGIKPTMSRASIETLPDTMQAPTEPMMLPPPAWPMEAPDLAHIPTQAVNQIFFHAASDSNPQFLRPDTTSEQPRNDWPAHDQDRIEALADDADREARSENRRSGITNQDDSQGMLFADLRSFETGAPYDADLDLFFKNSGLGEH